jgi:hypothetical protein
MKLAPQIVISSLILAIFAFEFFAPASTEASALLGLAVVCVVIAKRQGFKRAVILFLKEMW